MSPEIVGLAGIACLVVLLALGMYIGMAMALIGFLGLSILVGVEAGVHILGITPLAEGSSYTLSVIPLFVLMGQFAFISGISTDIYRTVYAWMGHFRGGWPWRRSWPVPVSRRYAGLPWQRARPWVWWRFPK